MKTLKFETVYNNSRAYVLGCMAGSRIEEQQKFAKDEVYERRVYQSFKQSVQEMVGVNIDTNAWEFDQNLLKNRHNGRQSLKSLCYSYYVSYEQLA